MLVPCKDGQERDPVTRRCRKKVSPVSPDSFIDDTLEEASLDEEQQKDLKAEISRLRKPMLKGVIAASVTSAKKIEPCDVAAVLSSAPVELLKAEMERRRYRVQSPVVNILVPRRKGDPRPS